MKGKDWVRKQEIKDLVEVAYHILNSTDENDNTVLPDTVWKKNSHDNLIENLSARMQRSPHHLYHLGKVASTHLKEKCFLDEYYCDDLDPCDHPKINDSEGDGYE